MAWHTLVGSIDEATSAGRFASLMPPSFLQKLVDVKAAEVPRQPTGLSEFDRVLGGGLVPGGVVLIGGDPGIGKSTLLLQALAALSLHTQVLYITGEESAEQVALRAKRLDLATGAVQLVAEIQLESIQAVLQQYKPAVAVIDSIQTLYSAEL